MIKLVVLLYCILAVSCTSKKGENTDGIIRVTQTVYDTVGPNMGRPIFTFSYRIWHKGLISIQEIKTLTFHVDTSGKCTWGEESNHFTYIDPHTNSICYYRNFSDTAQIVHKFSGIDSCTKDGGWNFYMPENITFLGEPVALTDTIIDRIKYKRVSVKVQGQERKSVLVGFFRCDLKDFYFCYYKTLSKKVGYPMVKMFDFSDSNPRSSEINIMTDTLSGAEERIFAAWGKREHAYH